MNRFTPIIPSLLIAVVAIYAFSAGIISLNNLVLLFIGLIVGTAASIFRSKKLSIEKKNVSQEAKK
jgi:preprotein translocase subunit SecF